MNNISQQTLQPTKQKNLEEICMVDRSPVKLENRDNEAIKPCGIVYNIDKVLYCSKYADGSCEYKLKEDK